MNETQSVHADYSQVGPAFWTRTAGRSMKDLLDDGEPIIAPSSSVKPAPPEARSTRNRNLDKALRLAGFGFRVLPCREKTTVDPETGRELKAKAPYTLRGIDDASAAPDVIRRWWTIIYPNALVGLSTDDPNGVGVVDIDVKDGKDGFAAVKTIFGELPATFTYTTPSGGEHRIYRRQGGPIQSHLGALKGLYDGKDTGLDIKADRGYVIVYADVPPDFPACLAEWPTTIDKAFEREGAARGAPPKKEATLKRPDATPEDLERAREALKHVPADDRDTWVKIGMALKDAFADDGRDVWDDWSKTSNKYNAKDQEAKWRSFNRMGIGIGTLFQIAQVNGWKPTACAEMQFGVGEGSRLFEGTDASEPEPASTPETDQQQSWGEPDPLAVEEVTEPYPLNALPTGIRDAVEEVVAFVQCPDALAACSALAQLSVAGQGCANVYRDETLCGPAGLYFLVIAKSGERKSQLDKHFGEGVRRYEREQTEIHRPKKREHLAALANWEARRKGIEHAIASAAKKGDDTAELEKKRQDLEVG
jgi:hypothetical protein